MMIFMYILLVNAFMSIGVIVCDKWDWWDWSEERRNRSTIASPDTYSTVTMHYTRNIVAYMRYIKFKP